MTQIFWRPLFIDRYVWLLIINNDWMFLFCDVRFKCSVGGRRNLIIWDPDWLKSVAIWIINTLCWLHVATCVSFVMLQTNKRIIQTLKPAWVFIYILHLHTFHSPELYFLDKTYARCRRNAWLTPSLSDIRSLQPAMGEPHQSASPHCSRPVHLPSPQRAWLEHKSITTKSLIGWRSGSPTERMRAADEKRHTATWRDTLAGDLEKKMATARYDER